MRQRPRSHPAAEDRSVRHTDTFGRQQQETERQERWRKMTKLSKNYARAVNSHPFAIPEEESYIKSATGGAIPGPKVSRSPQRGGGRHSPRADVPRFGVVGDEIDPRNIFSRTEKRLVKL